LGQECDWRKGRRDSFGKKVRWQDEVMGLELELELKMGMLG